MLPRTLVVLLSIIAAIAVLSIIAVSFANIWRGAAFSMLVYSAALSSVPGDVYESAALDGAGPVRRFVSVTVPLLRPAIATNLMLTTLQTLSVFGLIFIMTGGGPARQSQTLPLYMYEQAFSYGQLGYGTGTSSEVTTGSNQFTTPPLTKAGKTYTYFCRIHPFMRGSIRVRDDGKKS